MWGFSWRPKKGNRMGNEHHPKPAETPAQQIIARLDFIEQQLDDVLALLKVKAISIQFEVKFKGQTLGGNTMVALTPTNNAYDIVITGELAADGVTSVPLPTVAFGFAVNDPTLGIFTVNADGKSGTFVATKTQTASSAGFITMTDPVVGITAQSHFTFTVPPPPPPPTAATIVFTESAPHPGV
jgi:hypothetical protein